jgi:pimeloyl-ACP methyl ester carboxylesterase
MPSASDLSNLRRPPGAAPRSQQVRIGPCALPGDLDLPERSLALVLFAHGSGSSRLSSRNRWVAEVMQQHGLSTLLFDLLDDDEAADRRKVFDIGLLSERVQQAIDWTAGQVALAGMSIGLFGASTGAAAALCAAAARPGSVSAVVSRGGRPDLATGSLAQVRAPTLLIVGGADLEVLALNRQALGHLRCERRLEVVPGATHLFEEPGALGSVARLAASWFETHLGHRTLVP